jgi:hypothetical protein
MLRVNELVVTPFVTLTLLFLNTLDVASLLSATISVYRSWSEWISFLDLRFHMQHMYLTTMSTGGPHIVTNDPDYMPYVYADAVVRASMHRPGSATVPPLTAEPWRRIQSSSRAPPSPRP